MTSRGGRSARSSSTPCWRRRQIATTWWGLWARASRQDTTTGAAFGIRLCSPALLPSCPLPYPGIQLAYSHASLSRSRCVLTIPPLFHHLYCDCTGSTRATPSCFAGFWRLCCKRRGCALKCLQRKSSDVTPTLVIHRTDNCRNPFAQARRIHEP